MTIYDYVLIRYVHTNVHQNNTEIKGTKYTMGRILIVLN